MKYFAEIGSNNEVISVQLVQDNIATTEQAGSDFLNTLFKKNNMWKQTDIDTFHGKHYTITVDSEGREHRAESVDQTQTFRGNYAGIGFIWDEENNIFLPPKPYASWVKDISTAGWLPPIGNPPTLTPEQASQNCWIYEWNEDAYQADNNTGWFLIDIRV